jgi:uncharacterized membrane protein YhhN
MKKNYWILLFSLILAINLYGIYSTNELLQYTSKPLLLITLGIYFLLQTRIWKNDLKKWIVAALCFSWVGDLLLMFQPKDELFFLLGLSAFLIAHIFYIIYFHTIRIKESIKSSWLLLLMVVIYYAILITILSPHLGKMKLPVRLYGVVISFMFLLAMHMLFIKNKTAGQWMMAGALLFVLSDSILAINKFYQPFEWADILTMLTYGMAQLFITEGAVRYIRQEK